MGQLGILLLFVVMYSASLVLTCKEAERKALLEFKNSFIDEWNRLGSWVEQDCCNWKGVGCDTVTGNIIKLDLRGKPYPMNSQSYLQASEVNPALRELKHLSYLDLSGNFFNLSRIPEFLGSMSHLQYLNLSSSYFGGEVPPDLGNLTELVVLDLCTSCSYWEDIKNIDWDFNARDGMTLSQEVEMNNIEWAFKLENLQYLDLGGINLSQALDTLDVLHKLPSLSVLNLANCGLGNSHIVAMNSAISSSTLQHLDLQLNSFHGPIPHFIQNLSSIRYLNLAYNYFNGSFPYSIQNLSFLTSLDLSHNQFSSSIPSWLANKTYHLSLSGNHFNSMDGGIMNTIYSLCSLKYLDLSHNQLQEEVSESNVNFPGCSRYDLQYLYMKFNNISGYLPVIGSLSSLLALDLSYNNLEGIPPSLGGLSSLESISLSNNNLSVVHQVSLANLSSLNYLDLSSNSPIMNFSPDWMPPFQLEILSLFHCKLNSPFPKWVLSQKNMSELDLSETGIFGPLPNNIGTKMPSLMILRLASNHINGSIPRSLFNVESLGVLHLQNNRLSGMIPDCGPNFEIEVMDLSSNKLSGPIPNSLIANSYSLRLNNNLLGGRLPLISSFNNFSLLKLLDVSGNNLDGEIPPWNGATFSNLQILFLRENRFEGVIPLQLCSVQTLQVIDLASNNLAGTIPQCFGYFKAMRSMDMFSSETGWSEVGDQPIIAMIAQEVIKGQEREYTTILDQLISMDLSCNRFVGEIPTKITNLSLLLNLNLSHNHLTGDIPTDIGKMKSLESIDLSYNNLSGSIPESITSLDSLSIMNFSFNNFRGPIPTGRHLETLDDASIYMDNPGLCGDPLPVKCFPDDTAHPPTSMVLVKDEEDNKQEKTWFYIVVMLGFATGFWGVIGILVIHNRWRHAYFQIADELADWIYARATVRIARANRGK